MDISHWYSISGHEWFSDWLGGNHTRLVRSSPNGELIAVLTFGEGVSRKLRIFSGTGSFLVSIQWAVKWILDAGWTRALHFVTILSNGTVRVCTLNVKRRLQFSLPFRPIAGKVFKDGILLFESQGNVHFVDHNNLEFETHERLRSLGQLQLVQGEIPIAIVTRRSVASDNNTNQLNQSFIQMDSSVTIYFCVTTCHENLIVSKSSSNIPPYLITLNKNLGFVVREGLLDFYKSFISISKDDLLQIYSIDLEKFDEITFLYSIKLEIIPNTIFLTTSYIILNKDNQIYIKLYNRKLKYDKAGDTFLDDHILSNNLIGGSDDFYSIGPNSECHIIGFYQTPIQCGNFTNHANVFTSKTDSVEFEEGVRLLYPQIGEVWLVRSGMDWYKDVVNNIDNPSYKLFQAYKTFSQDSSEAFALKIDLGKAVYGCIQAASATLDFSLSELYLEAAVFGRRLNGFTSLSIPSYTNSSSITTNDAIINDDSSNETNVNTLDVNKLWASTCGWIRIIRTMAKSPIDHYITISEGKFITIERICEAISARGFSKIAFSISKFSNCSPCLAYHQYAVTELLDSSHLPDNDVIGVFNNCNCGFPNGVLAKISKIAASPPFSRNALAQSLYDKERCPYARACLVNTVSKGSVKITQFPTDLVRVMIESNISLPLYHRHYLSSGNMKICQKILERMGANCDAATNATAIGYNCRDRIKEAKNWFGYSQSFSKACKNQLLYQSADEMLVLLKHNHQNSSIMHLIFDLFVKNDFSTAMEIAEEMSVPPIRLGICLVSSCILNNDLHPLKKFSKDKRIEIPQDLLQQAYGHVGVTAEDEESRFFFQLWK